LHPYRTLFPGHGIGPEISKAVTEIIDASGANIEWETYDIGTPVPGSSTSLRNSLFNTHVLHQMNSFHKTHLTVLQEMQLH